MGCFDSVIAKCPKCDTDVEWQSKADKCSLRTYSPLAVPVVIAKDIERDTVKCPGCGTELCIKPYVPINTIAMVVSPVSQFSTPDEDDY